MTKDNNLLGKFELMGLPPGEFVKLFELVGLFLLSDFFKFDSCKKHHEVVHEFKSLSTWTLMAY